MTTFDYKGYTAEQINILCDKKLARRGVCKPIYWVPENYSIGRYYREYAGFPSWLRFYAYAQHGINDDPRPDDHELYNDAEFMLVNNQASVAAYEKASPKPCYLVTMPYVLHRRRHNIIQASDAQGTLIFPAHSTTETDIIFDVEKYIDEMKSLPAEFHPLCFIFHMADVHKGAHLIYMKKELPVYTAGVTDDLRFGDRLYDIMRHFKHTMSNHVGSYAYYSVEMGIPFSCIGREMPVLLNNNDPNLGHGMLDFSANPHYMRAASLFSGLNTAITTEQREFAESILGIGQGLSGPELRKILFEAYRNRRGRGRLVTDTLRAAGRKVRSMIKTYS